jgi:hypothetical protein
VKPCHRIGFHPSHVSQGFYCPGILPDPNPGFFPEHWRSVIRIAVMPLPGEDRPIDELCDDHAYHSALHVRFKARRILSDAGVVAVYHS